MWHPPPPTSERLSRSLSPLDSTNPTEQLLLHHFAQSASRITSCYPGIQTSFNSLLLPMAISYPPLLSALMALFAIHRNSLYTLSPATLQHPNEIDYLKASSVTQLRSDLLFSAQQQPQMGLLQRWYTSISTLAAISPQGLRAGDLHPATSPTTPPDPPLSAANEKKEVAVFLDDYFGFSTDLVDMFKEIGAAAWERRILSSNSPLTLDSESEAMRVHVNLSEEDLTTEVRNLELRVLDMMARDPPPFYPGVQEKLDEEVRMEFYLCNEAY